MIFITKQSVKNDSITPNKIQVINGSHITPRLVNMIFVTNVKNPPPKIQPNMVQKIRITICMIFICHLNLSYFKTSDGLNITRFKIINWSNMLHNINGSLCLLMSW